MDENRKGEISPKGWEVLQNEILEAMNHVISELEGTREVI